MKKFSVLLLCVLLFSALVAPVQASLGLAEGVVHVVLPGQTLFGIALWYGVDMWTLARANNIVNPNHIYVGQQLLVPTATAAPAPAVVAAPAQSASGSYVVKLGDTLFSIGRAYGVTAAAIANANGLYNMNHIYVGQMLVIPGLAPAPVAKPQPVASPAPVLTSGTGWHASYYDGTEIKGGPLFERTDRAVNFHWGKSSPDTRLNTDGFAVNWTRTINFRGGVYRFELTVDDGARIWVDGDLALDAWEVQPETTYEVDVILTPGKHLISIDYFDDSGPATIQYSFKRLGAAPVEPTPAPGSDDDGAQLPSGAWYGEYFGNDKLSGDAVVTRMDENIGFDWAGTAPMSGIPDNYFSVRWTRKAYFYEDNYKFCAMADDGVRLYVDNVLVIDEWHGSNSLTYCTEVDMTKGDHAIKVEYYEDGGEALVYIWWERH